MSSSWCTAFCCSADDYFRSASAAFSSFNSRRKALTSSRKSGRALEERAGAGEVSGIDGGRSHEGLAIGAGAVDAGLRTGLQTIGQLQMTGDTYLSAEHAPLPHLGASGHADLGRHHRVGTDFDIVGDLHQIASFSRGERRCAHRRAGQRRRWRQFQRDPPR